MFYNASFSQKAVTIKLSTDQSFVKSSGEKIEYILDEDMFHSFYAIIFIALKKNLGENLKAVYVLDGEAKFVYEKGIQNPIDLSGLTKAYYGCCCECTLQRIYKRMTGENWTPEIDRKHEFVSKVLQNSGQFMSI